jgi:hypothetical protein
MKEKFELHYASINLDTEKENIQIFEFETNRERFEFVKKIVRKNDFKLVTLIAFDDEVDQSIYIGDEYVTFEPLFRSSDEDVESFAKVMHLQEYKSYEEAYKSALEMKEVSPLCYS